MNYLATLRDKDVFPNKNFPEVVEWIERKTVKIILRNEKRGGEGDRYRFLVYCDAGARGG